MTATPTPTKVSIKLPVTGAPDGDPSWEEVEWRRYVYKGQLWVVATVYAWDADRVSDSRSWSAHNPILGGEEPPAWVPRPPAEWFALAALVVPAEAVAS